MFLQTVGGAATPPPRRPDKGIWEDALQRSRVLAFTAPAFTRSSFHVIHILRDDWSVRVTWAGAARGGAGQGGRRGGAEGRGWRGWFGAGAVGSRQINMESIFHEKVSVRVRWRSVCCAVAAVGRGTSSSWSAGGGPSRPHPSLAGRSSLIGRGASPTPPPHPVPQRPVPEESRAGDAGELEGSEAGPEAPWGTGEGCHRMR